MEETPAQTVLVAVEVELPPNTLVRMSIWHLAVAAAVPAASAVLPATSAPVAPVAAVAAAVPLVVYSGTANGYYHAGAFGGDGGKNADGTSASDGADVELTNPKYADLQGVGLRDSASKYTDDAGWENGNGRHDGGAGGAAGSASVGGSYGTRGRRSRFCQRRRLLRHRDGGLEYAGRRLEFDMPSDRNHPCRLGSPD